MSYHITSHHITSQHITSHHITSLLVYRDNAAQFCFTCPHSLHATHCIIQFTSHHITSHHITSHRITSLLVYRDNAAQFCFTCPHSLHATHCIIVLNMNLFFLSIFDYQHHHYYFIDSIIHCLTYAFIHFIKQVVQHGEESIGQVVISSMLHVVTTTLEM